MGNPLDTLRELWQRLSINQRALLVIGAGVLIAVSTAAISYTTRPVLVTLYSGLESKDAAAVTDGLRDQKIPYDVSSDGTIKVPQEHVNQLRLTFAEKGIPHSGELGYELFDKPMLGMTDFLQKMNYHRAVEGELARTMTSIEGVENARVHLVVPEKRLFKEDQKPATASVVLTMKTGHSLNKKQVAALASLTAYAVEGLDPENVTIMDSEGNPLTNGARDELAGLSSTQLEMQQSIEAELESKAENLIEDVVGPGRSRVEVTVKLNWNRIERTSEDYNPDRIATLSEETQSSEDTQTGTSEKLVTNYQVPRTVERVVPEVGNIERIWASVLIDGVYENGSDAEGNPTQTYIERTPQELEKFRSLVANALGIDATRSDELTVISFQFTGNKTSPEQVNETPTGWLDLLQKFADKIVLLFVLLLAFFAIRGFMSKVSDRLPQLPAAVPAGALSAGAAGHSLPGGSPEQLGGATHAQLQQGAQAGGAASPMGKSGVVMGEDGPKVIFKSGSEGPKLIELDDEGPSIEALRSQEILNRTIQFVINKPDNAAQILRAWVADAGN
ncbi:MAG: flagellar M-ring protein FliF [Calditrichaeota bacterium]|nr:flagellar M-ring protein FliF [Calditrichota bacterium]